MTLTVAVAGLGAMGSAAAWRLARRGARVVGFDRYRPPHGLGSTHGGSRVIRETAFEHPRYVPLVRHAYQLWAELSAEAGRPLLTATGGLFLGAADAPVVKGSRESAAEHGIDCELLSATEVRRRWPVFHPDQGMLGLTDPRAGLLDPEACVRAALAAAVARGAVLMTDQPVTAWKAVGDGVLVTTPLGDYRADRLVLALGAWMPAELGPLGVSLSVERVMMHWFTPRESARFAPERCPVQVWETPDAVFAGFPLVEGSLKFAIHHAGETTTAVTVRREVTAGEVGRMRVLLERYVPEAAGSHLRSEVCLYTNTPDGHFFLDRHPEHPQVVLASPCSGFGFKFAPAIGEILADLATGSRPGFDLTPFSATRFKS